MTIRISKVAVLGSGVMGSALACHLANCGYEVLMLDILPKGDDVRDRNAVAKQALKTAMKSKPAPLYHKDFAKRITLGNFDDDLHRISECDWILEAIVERLDIKNSLYEKVEKHRRPGTIVSSNTSGIPIHMMAEPRSEDFKKHFLGTHFFNPPRYLKLLEIIPTPDTSEDVIKAMEQIGSVQLGKTVVHCKDTPAFIANRIGVFAMSKIYQFAEELGLDVVTVDKLTGPGLARPNTGTFRLGDLVGLDVADKVIKGVQQNAPHDKEVQQVQSTKAMRHLLDNGFLGNKTGQGFFKKTKEKDDKGRSIILGLNLETLEYEPRQRVEMDSLKQVKMQEDVLKRIKALYAADDKGGQLVKKSLLHLWAYAAHRIPEISDDIYSVDRAMRTGFGWDYGPFEYWDMIGLEDTLDDIKAEGLTLAPWVEKMMQDGHKTFYKTEGQAQMAFDPIDHHMALVPESDKLIRLDRVRSAQAAVYSNDEITLHDIGDGVLCLEYTSKMNAIGEGILRGTQEAIRIAEEDGWKGLVIANDSKNFTVGANLMMVGMMAFQKQWDQLDDAVSLFQQTSMRCRYSSIPVVAATQGYVFGGGCEFTMHCDSVIAASESYIGLVEVGVGLLPGGGGTKEFALRASDDFANDEIKVNHVLDRFKTIAMASVATSADEAFSMGYLDHRKDERIINADHRIGEAKKKVLALAEDYVAPVMRSDVHVLGRAGMATLLAAAHSLKLGRYATDHDIVIAQKVAHVLCGGDLSAPQDVSEKYLLDIEREAFISLCGEAKTLERIQHMLEKGKPLRN